MMKKVPVVIILITLLICCRRKADLETARNEILQTEKAFQKMASEKGLSAAFYYFATEDAVIRRGNDSLIFGRENIKQYYDKNANPDGKLSWSPDFVEVSDCGTLGYTYGRFIFSVKDTSGKNMEQKGVFHTIWKKQDNGWRYVWD